jgi:hypothetical protein
MADLPAVSDGELEQSTVDACSASDPSGDFRLFQALPLTFNISKTNGRPT